VSDRGPETVRSADGTEIAFERRGAGPPLVLVGGALNDRRSPATLASRLAARFTVVTYDRRGRGDSGDAAPYAVEREVEDLEALVDAAAGGSAFAFGHSSGAVLVLRAAERTSALTRLALYEPPFILDGSRPPVPDDYVRHLDELVATGRRGDAVAYFLETGVELPAAMVARMREAPFWSGAEALAHTLPYDGRIMGEHLSGRPFPPDAWSAVAAPALVMDGGDSPPWQRSAARALADALPNAKRVTLEGQTHEVADEALTPELERFFLG